MTPTFSTALESLTRRQRQVLALHEIDRVSPDRIGSLIGTSPAQVRIELRQARLAMCRQLSRETRTAA
jgi:DNA-directed RNA polymerase specialized sigma24 family protein